MTQPIARRIALRAVQLAIVAAGIFVIMLVFSRQAHAATTDTNPLAGKPAPTALSAAGSVVDGAASSVTSTVSQLTSGNQAAASSAGTGGASSGTA
ncbi:MAG TPA: hypothetical protein VH589_03780, partial [Trebonia sp.]